MDKQISEYLTYTQATYSNVAFNLHIDNQPNAEQLAFIYLTAINIYDPLYSMFKSDLCITSFFRSQALNTVLKGSAINSQHIEGKAIDLVLWKSPQISDIFNYVKDFLLFDQLIWEKGNNINPDWVHVSYNPNKNRKQIIKPF